MAHETSAEAEALLDVRHPVLDKGFVQLVDYMGGDRRIAEAAWVSSMDEVEADKKTPAAVRRIINYMMEFNHSSPFEQVVLTFRAKMPIFVARQFVRHRTARLNEMSGRYRILPHEAYLPADERIQGKGTVNKQGSEGTLDDITRRAAVVLLQEGQRKSYDDYGWMDRMGIANELARINLPLSQYTEWYWQIDLHNLFHFLRLRLDAHAQWEIQQYAEKLAMCAKAVAPIAYAAFREFKLNAITFSATEMEVLRRLVDSEQDTQARAGAVLSGSRARRFAEKLKENRR